MIRVLGVLLAAIVASAVVGIVYLAITETREISVSEYSGAKPLINRGWLPSWLPESAENISVKYNLDTNAAIARFAAEAEDEDSWLPDGCEEKVPGDTAPPELEASWFPKPLSGHEALNATTSLWACGKRHFLLKKKSGREVYYWKNAG